MSRRRTDRPTWVEWAIDLIAGLYVIGGLLLVVVGLGTVVVALLYGRPDFVATGILIAVSALGVIPAVLVFGAVAEVLGRLREIARSSRQNAQSAAELLRISQDAISFAEVRSQPQAEADLGPESDPSEAAGDGPESITRSAPVSSFLDDEPAPAGKRRFRVTYRRKDGSVGRQEVEATDAGQVRRAVERRGHQVEAVEDRIAPSYIDHRGNSHGEAS